jgi:HlyD family secretion protein
MDREVGRKRSRKLLLGGLVIVTVCIVAVVYLFPSLSRWASAERSIDAERLRFGSVTRGDLLRDVSVQGKIIAADRPTLVSPVRGLVTLLVEAGDVVRSGDTMARIESPELQNSLEQEQSVSLSMKSDLEKQKIIGRQNHLKNEQDETLLEVKLTAAERAMERARSLFEQGLGSSLDFEKAQDEVVIARLELDHAKEKTVLDKENMDFEIQVKELQLDRQGLVVDEVKRKIAELTVASPVSGLVSRVDVRDKDTVQPAQPLFSVVDLSLFEVEVLIPENYADEISAGTVAMVHYEGREYQGEVKSYSPEVENSQVKGVVIFTEDPPSRLKQNQRVETRLILDSRTDVLKVARGPFLESLGGRQVYVVEDEIATLRQIQVGSISVTEVEVVSGLDEGDEVVLSDLTRFEGTKSILLRR